MHFVVPVFCMLVVFFLSCNRIPSSPFVPSTDDDNTSLPLRPLNPVYGSHREDTVVNLVWNGMNDTASVLFNVYLDTVFPGSKPVATEISDTFVNNVGGLKPGTRYIWYVEAISNSIHDTSSYWHFSTALSGLQVFDSTTMPLVHSAVKALVPGLGTETLLAGSNEGIITFLSSGWDTTISAVPGILRMVCGVDSTLWALAATPGLSRRSTGQTAWQPVQGVLDKAGGNATVSDIAVSPGESGRLWIATSNGPLSRSSDGSAKRITGGHIDSTSITCVGVCAQDDILTSVYGVWIGTPDGLFYLQDSVTTDASVTHETTFVDIDSIRALIRPDSIIDSIVSDTTYNDCSDDSCENDICPEDSSTFCTDSVSLDTLDNLDSLARVDSIFQIESIDTTYTRICPPGNACTDSGGVVAAETLLTMDTTYSYVGLDTVATHYFLKSRIHHDTAFTERHDTLWMPVFPDSITTAWRSRSITCIASDTAGTMWVGTSRGDLLSFDGTTLTQHDAVLPDYRVSAFAFTQNLVVWVAQWGGGITRYDPVTTSAKRYDIDNSALPSSQVNDLVIDEQNRLWIATEGGILVFTE